MPKGSLYGLENSPMNSGSDAWHIEYLMVKAAVYLCRKHSAHVYTMQESNQRILSSVRSYLLFHQAYVMARV